MVQIKNLRIFNGIDFVVHSARASGVQGDFTEKEIFDMIVKNDYSSALEHVYVTYELCELSKGNAPELLEHRIASHTGRSTRYIDESGFDYNLGPKIKEILKKHGIGEEDYKEGIGSGGNGGWIDKVTEDKDAELLTVYANSVATSRDNYRRLIELGMGKETARYVTPFSMHTMYTYTENLRALINKFGLRLCVRASPEMQEYALKLYRAVWEKEPALLEHVWCRGFNRASCPENEVRDSPQAKECPFKNSNDKMFIPTDDDIRYGRIPEGYGGFDFEIFKNYREKKLDTV